MVCRICDKTIHHLIYKLHTNNCIHFKKLKQKLFYINKHFEIYKSLSYKIIERVN